MATNVRVESKKVWSDEELRRLASLEAELGDRTRNVNIELQKRHTTRSLEAIKGVRRRPDYRELVEQARLALRGVPAIDIMEAAHIARYL